MMAAWKKYPSLGRIAQLGPPQKLLGKEIHWEEKRDGSNIRVSIDENEEIVISSRNQEHASEDFIKAFHRTEESSHVVEFVKDFTLGRDEFSSNFIHNPIVFGELLVKGKSPTRTEIHEKDEYIVFDIYNNVEEMWYPFSLRAQIAWQYNFPICECWAITRHTTMDSLYKMRDELLERCRKEPRREGVVLKAYGSQPIFAKEKLDSVTLDKIPRKIENGKPQPPQLPESEIYGAIAKVHTDLGDEQFNNKSVAMPKIVEYVKEENKKHMCQFKGNLYRYYILYLENIEGVKK